MSASSPELLAALKDGVSLHGGWREAIVELEDWCGEPVRLKNMLAAADQLDRWAAIARAAIARAEGGCAMTPALNDVLNAERRLGHAEFRIAVTRMFQNYGAPWNAEAIVAVLHMYVDHYLTADELARRSREP